MTKPNQWLTLNRLGNEWRDYFQMGLNRKPFDNYINMLVWYLTFIQGEGSGASWNLQAEVKAAIAHIEAEGPVLPVFCPVSTFRSRCSSWTVDLEAAVNTCARNLRADLIDGSLLFWSERWWRENFATTSPGMIGSGCGLPFGTYYVEPWEKRFHDPLQKPSIVAYPRKGMSGYGSFYPEDRA